MKTLFSSLYPHSSEQQLIRASCKPGYRLTAAGTFSVDRVGPTNATRGITVITGPPVLEDISGTSQSLTNIPGLSELLQATEYKKEIRPSVDGAVADYGLLKVQFAPMCTVRVL